MNDISEFEPSCQFCSDLPMQLTFTVLSSDFNTIGLFDEIFFVCFVSHYLALCILCDVVVVFAHNCAQLYTIIRQIVL